MRSWIACALACACGHAPPVAGPAARSLADALRADARGGPIVLATNEAGVAAYTINGALLMQLTTGHTAGVELDGRRYVLLFTDEDDRTLSALDLNDTAPSPVVLATSELPLELGLGSDDGRVAPPAMQIAWTAHPSIVWRPYCPPGWLCAKQDVPREIATVRITGAAWIARIARRPAGRPREIRAFDRGRASLSPPYEMLGEASTCVVHDRESDEWLEPSLPEVWWKRAPHPGDELCRLVFDATGTFYLKDAEICELGRPCGHLDGVSHIVDWLDTGFQVGTPPPR
jgi:hypothetical protein